jgi:hypothetical protein
MKEAWAQNTLEYHLIWFKCLAGAQVTGNFTLDERGICTFRIEWFGCGRGIFPQHFSAFLFVAYGNRQEKL